MCLKFAAGDVQYAMYRSVRGLNMQKSWETHIDWYDIDARQLYPTLEFRIWSCRTRGLLAGDRNAALKILGEGGIVLDRSQASSAFLII